MPTQSSTSKTCMLNVKQIPDSDELFLEFTPELISELGWMTGDELRWTLGDKKDEASIVNLSKAARDARAEGVEGGTKL